MQIYNETDKQEFFLQESIKELENVNKKLARLAVLKEELVENIIGALGHEHEGQKTYEYNAWKIEVKTPCVYTLNKKRYEQGDIELPKKFNPIKKTISYTVDKRMVDQIMMTAPEDIRNSLVELIDKKPGKANVVIKERV